MQDSGTICEGVKLLGLAEKMHTDNVCRMIMHLFVHDPTLFFRFGVFLISGDLDNDRRGI